MKKNSHCIPTIYLYMLYIITITYVCTKETVISGVTRRPTRLHVSFHTRRVHTPKPLNCLLTTPSVVHILLNGIIVYYGCHVFTLEALDVHGFETRSLVWAKNLAISNINYNRIFNSKFSINCELLVCTHILYRL